MNRLLTSIFAAMALVLTCGPTANATDTQYFDIAMQAARWIVNSATSDGKTVYWSDELIGQSTATYDRELDLYSGVSGSIVYLLEAHGASNGTESSFLKTAVSAADHLVSKLDGALAAGMDTNLYHGGASGVGFALWEMYKATGDDQYRAGAMKVVDYIKDQADASGSLNKLYGVRWGGAGVGFFMLYMHQELAGDTALLSLAEAQGRYLISQGVSTNGGLTWYWSGQSGLEMPNYAEGASGVGYFLATLYHISGDATFLAGARSAATYLLSVADLSDGGCLVPHSNQYPGMYYLAECNGPAGTGRFWLRMHQVTGESNWLQLAEASALSIRTHSPYPNGHYNFVMHTNSEDPFWDNIGQCDGAAGAAEYGLLMFSTTAGETHKDFLVDVANDIAQRGTAEGRGAATTMKWVTVEWRTEPSSSTGAQSGYMQGAAGVGSLFLGIHNALVAAEGGSVVDSRVYPPDHPRALGFAPASN